MDKYKGQSLIELIFFIVIMGIVAKGILSSVTTVFLINPKPQKMSQALYFAKARMEIILMSRNINGFTAFTDPCSGGSPPSACTALTAFGTTNNYTATSTITAYSAGVTSRTITVNVTGAFPMTLSTVTNYYEA